ncbi:carboxylesterase family protein [Geodermatophilus normandii]|uniref:carboxylesterase family protein n=1 Tax=Geodermatophilus normandii TaxID=1137989 RepID=UPI001953F4A2|nr:carboxylesterase family protein [Geodermatophilus normandii]
MGDLVADEDCLRLSVTVPEDAGPGAGLPVMVWVHGGSYVSGAGDAPAYDPAALVREQRVVVVGVTYRLGVLGFLGGWDGRPADLGLLDLLQSWLRAHRGGRPGAAPARQRGLTVRGRRARRRGCRTCTPTRRPG